MLTPRVSQVKATQVKKEVLPFLLFGRRINGEGSIIVVPLVPLLSAVPVKPAANALPVAQDSPAWTGTWQC